MTNRRDRRSSSFAVDQVEHEVLAAPTGLERIGVMGSLGPPQGAAVGRVIYDEPVVRGDLFRIRPSSEGTNRKRFPCSTPNRLGLCRLMQANRFVANRGISRRSDHA